MPFAFPNNVWDFFLSFVSPTTFVGQPYALNVFIQPSCVDHAQPYHIISYPILSYHIISYHILSYHIISYHIISYHILSSHAIRATSYQSVYPTLNNLMPIPHSTTSCIGIIHILSSLRPTHLISPNHHCIGSPLFPKKLVFRTLGTL